MTHSIEDIDGDTIEVKAYAEHHRTQKPYVSVSIETAEGDSHMAVHLTPSAARALIKELELAVKHS